jgi:hypothetical protein
MRSLSGGNTMQRFRYTTGRPRIPGNLPVLLGAVLIIACFGSGTLPAGTVHQETFRGPEEASRALVEAVRTADRSQWAALFGPSGKDFYPEGQKGRPLIERFLKDYVEKHRLETVGRNKVVLIVGKEDWPWPFPLVKVGTRWRFDVKQGRREIMARRIGRNETAAVQVCLAYVDAQQEYAETHRTPEGLGEYAQRFFSDPGQENGLCWIPGKEERSSPLGPLIAGACQTKGELPGRETATPYHGYYYRILTGQGRDAPGGAYSYLFRGRMVGGFGLVAYPAAYGRSAIMTFMINRDGQVYEKDLGSKTETIARGMEVFNPDKTWRKVE